jgi:hypothetical protein
MTNPTPNRKAVSAEELRIGNHVHTSKKGTVVIAADDIINVSQNRCQYFGIPLTPEILERCGFEQYSHMTITDSWWIDVGRHRRISIGCVGTPNEMLCVEEHNREGTKITDVCVIHNFDYDGKLYLHKLQNIGSVFGTELILKPIA